MQRLIAIGIALAALGCAGTAATTTALQSHGANSSQGEPPAFGAITEGDLRRDLEVMAGDAMRGREAGTLDEMRASVWVAERAREAGLEPAGDDGTALMDAKAGCPTFAERPLPRSSRRLPIRYQRM